MVHMAWQGYLLTVHVALFTLWYMVMQQLVESKGNSMSVSRFYSEKCKLLNHNHHGCPIVLYTKKINKNCILPEDVLIDLMQ